MFSVDALNDGMHSVMKFSPRELWNTLDDMQELAVSRAAQEHEHRNQKRTVNLVRYYESQIANVWDESRRLD